MPATCPNCGRRTNPADQFCDGCGAFLGWQAGESGGTQVNQRPPQADQHAGVQLQFKNALIKVAPGSAESATFTVKNVGTQVEEFRFFVTGPAWIVVEPAAASVYPGQEATAALRAAPPRQPSSAAGVITFQLTVRSAVHANVSSSAAGRVDVAPYYELAAELVPTSTRGRGSTSHHVALHNRGNSPLRVALNATDVADGLQLGLAPFADVPPGTVTQVPVTVRGSRRWFGRPEPKTFSVIAEAPKPLAATRLPGTRTVDALFPRWVPAAAAALVVAGAASAAVIPKLTANNGPGPVVTTSPPTSAPPTTTSPSTSPTTPPTTASSSSAPPTTASPATTPPTTPAVSSPSPVDLTATAPAAAWSMSGPSVTANATPPVQHDVGCQIAPGTVFSLQNVVLEDGTLASTALELDPPPDAGAGVIGGVYTLPAPTVAGEVFRADVGFCWGTAAGVQMQYQVIVGAQSSSPVTLTSGTGQPKSISETLPAGTTQIELLVQNGPADTGDLVWVDPRIEAGSASPTPSRSTVTPSPTPIPTLSSPQPTP